MLGAQLLSAVATKVANESQPRTLKTLTSNSDFRRVFQQGTKQFAGGLVVVSAPHQDSVASARVGFVASRKLGNAPSRNRAKRRLRAAARQVAFRPGRDFIVIATKKVLECEFVDIVDWMTTCSAGHEPKKDS